MLMGQTLIEILDLIVHALLAFMIILKLMLTIVNYVESDVLNVKILNIIVLFVMMELEEI
jgi:hypothetical protein